MADKTKAELAAELAALDAELESGRTSRADAAETERLTQAIADKRALIAAEKEHGDRLATFETPEGMIIVRQPSQMRFRKYQAVITRLSSKETDSANAQLLDESMKLVLECLVHPANTRFDQIVERYPGVPNLLAGRLVELANGGAKKAAEK